MPWPEPSERINELLRQGAGRVLESLPELVDELDVTTLSAMNMEAIAEDPVLRSGSQRSSRSNVVAWATANLGAPGKPVAANLGAETLGFSRDLVRRGLNESALDSYRVGQNAVWRRWMEIAFGLTSDVNELHELLDVSAQSISEFLDATVLGIAAQMAVEREELTQGTNAERREVIALIVEGAPISRSRAESRLGYALDRTHTAAVIWSDDPVAQPQPLERIAEALMKSAQTGHALTVIASAATLWLWLPAALSREPDHLARRLDDAPGVHIAVGRPGSGLDGFRRSHLDALTTQRMLARLQSPQRLATFNDVQLSNLMSRDREESEDFIHSTLGMLTDASPALRQAVLTYIEAGSNASRAADQLYIHRNTLIKNLERANQLLPLPLQDNLIRVAVALDCLKWRGRPED